MYHKPITMIIYNVTVNVESDIHDEWLLWLKEVHIPDVLKTGLFTENKVCRVLGITEEEGHTYSVQYTCKSMNEYVEYRDNHAQRLQAEYNKRYEGKFVAFRTLLEVV